MGYSLFPQDELNLYNPNNMWLPAPPQAGPPSGLASAPRPVPTPLPDPAQAGFNIQNQAKGSGRTETGELNSNSKSGMNTNEATYLSPEQYRDLANSVRNLDEVKSGQANLDTNRALFQKYLSEKPDFDLATPLSNLSDYLQTGKLGTRAPKDESAKDHAKTILDWAKTVQDDQRDQAKLILEGVGKAKSGFTNEQVLSTLGLKHLIQAQDPTLKQGANNQATNYTRWMSSVDRDPVIKKTPDLVNVLSNARQMLEGNSPVDASNFRYELLRGLGVPRITNYELAGEQGSKSFWGRLDQQLETLKTGTLTEENKKDYLQLINSIQQAHMKEYDQHRQFHIQRGVHSPLQISPQDAEYGVNSLQYPTGLGQVPITRNAPATPAPKPAAVSSGGDAGMDAFLKSRKKP